MSELVLFAKFALFGRK